MSDFKTATATLQPPDPGKRVNYTFGLVLGPDEFIQEQAYFLGKHRLHNRLLHGYGTASGLQVVIDPAGAGPEVRVSPGVAVNPQGQEICVDHTMCAKLNSWLSVEKHREGLRAVYGPPPFDASLCVVLCYRECETNVVPVPGDPCRSQADAMAPSRIADSFDLLFCIDTPASPPLTSPPETTANGVCTHCPSQVEEDAVRAFGALLDRIVISDEGTSFLTRAELEALVRALGAPSSPPTSPPVSSPPGSPFILHPADACDFLRAAFRVWVTEVRPQLGDCEAGPCDPPRERCVLLAELRFRVSAAWEVEGAIAVDEERRPLLMSTRLLQEWLLCGREASSSAEGQSRTFATLSLSNNQSVRAWIHWPALLGIPAAAVAVSIDDGPEAAAAAVAGVAGTNVYDIQLAAPVADGTRIAIGFDAAGISEQDSPPRSLIDVLGAAHAAVLDRDGSRIWSYVVYRADQVGTNDHGGLAGLGDDDHPQYFNEARGDARYAPIAHSHPLVSLTDVNAAPTAANDGQALTWNEATQRWVLAAVGGGGVNDHGALTGLADDDHPQYLLVNGTRALTGDLSAGAHKLTQLAAATANGDAVRFEQAVKVGDAAGGDLGGAYPNPTVAKLQGRAVANTNPGAGNVLTWNAAALPAGQWEPRAVPQAPPPAIGPLRLLPFVTLTRVSAGSIQVWFNIDAPNNDVAVRGLDNGMVRVFAELDLVGPGPRPFLDPVNVTSFTPERRNAFRLKLANEAELLRFVFRLPLIPVDPGGSLMDHMQANQWQFVGFDGNDTVTAFLRTRQG